jgi:hypothetical protein
VTARTWTADGITVTGVLPGHDDITYAPTRRPRTGTAELHHLADRIARFLNGEPNLRATDQAVLDAVITHQQQHTYPASALQIGRATGLSRATVHNSFNRLTAAGYGSRPAPDEVEPNGRRPFVAHMPGVTR